MQFTKRILKIPTLGSIGLKDYNLSEMPSPQLVNIEKYRFDFKSSLRNEDYRMGKQYDNHELKQLFPSLYYKNFKKDPVPLQFTAPENTLPVMTDPSF